MPLNQYVLPWDSQPQEVVGIGQNFDAAFCYLPPVSRAFDLVFSSALTEYNVAGVAVDSIGVTTAITSATGSIAGLSVRLDSTKVQTAIIQFRNTASNTDGILMAAKTHYSNAYGWMFESKTNENTLEFIGGNGILFPTMSAPGVGSADGRYKTVVVEWAGATVRAAMNGVYLGSVTVDAIGGSNAGVGVLNYSNNGASGGNSTNRRVALSAVLYGRYDILSLSANPWQLFAPRSIWVPSSSLKVPTRRRLIEQVTPWESQPQEPVGIDWGNPTTSGLVFAWEGSVPSHDLRSSAATIPFSTGIGSGVSLHGRTVTFSGSQANQSFGLSAFNGLAAATGATYDILVFFSGANPTAKFFSQWDLGAGVQRWLLESSGGNLVWVAGDTDGNGASRSRFDLSGAFPAAGWYRITASWGGAGVNSLWINGTKRSPSTVSSGCTVINSTTMGLFIGGSGSSPLNGAVAFARIWRRGLQDAEIASIQNSGAWQLFTPRQEWILSSSEVLMPTLSLPTLTGIGSTTARPRVSITY